MPSTHLSLHFHVVFSTKNREPRIAAEWHQRLHAYLGGVARKSGSVPEAVGGVADHVHLLLGLTATARLADVVRDIKAPSMVTPSFPPPLPGLVHSCCPESGGLRRRLICWIPPGSGIKPRDRFPKSLSEK
jgi:hypothetical protein